jgi:hypothetical protein
MRRIFAGLSVLMLCQPASASQALAQTVEAQAERPRELTAEQWRADLRFMVEELQRRHPDLYHAVSREAFDAAVTDLDRRIPTLRRNEVIVGMMRIAAMVGDGHTRLDPRKDEHFGFPALPLKLYLFDDGLYIRAARPDHAHLVGARIEAIGGVPVAEALTRVNELTSRDNDMGATYFAPLYLNMPDILQALGLSDRHDRATLTVRRGDRRWRVNVEAGAVDPLWPPDTDISLITPEGWVDARATPAPPLWLAAPLDYHRLVEMPERGVLYAQLNMVAGIQGESLGAYGVRIRERAEALNPRIIILDLRLNGGGNGTLRNRFIPELVRAEDEDTRLIVLTGRGTFSASQFVLDDLDRLTNAVFIGEPARSRPSSFGDSYRSEMPNSGISTRASTLWWQDGQSLEPWTWVDVSAPFSFADYAAGRDPALEAALNYAPRPPLHEQLNATFASGGATAVQQALDAYVNDPANRYANVRQNIVIAADFMLGARQHEAAMPVAQFAAERFPYNSSAASVLAYAAEAQGNRDLARREATRAIALDSNNRFARSLLDRLEE